MSNRKVIDKVKLYEICDIKSGGTPSRGKREYWSNGEIPWVKIGDFNGKYIDTVEETITYEGLKNSSAKMIEKGSILFTIFATIGEVAILKFDVTTNQAIAGITVTDSRVEKEYLYYYLKSIKTNINNKGRGVAQNNINLSILKNLEVPIVSLKYQKNIVNILNRIDYIIELRIRQLNKINELTKSLFIEMFGDPSTNLKGWNETTIGNECFYIKDGPHKSLPDIGKENGGHPFISVRNIVNGYIDLSTARYISDEDYNDAIKKCHPEKGDMLYSKGGTTGIAKLIDIDNEFANWVHVAVLKFNKVNLNGIFFENMLNGDYCYKQSQKLTKGIANKDLVLSAISQIKIYRPPIELQNKFAAVVAQIDKSKLAVKKSLEELEILKKSLMQKYFA